MNSEEESSAYKLKEWSVTQLRTPMELLGFPRRAQRLPSLPTYEKKNAQHSGEQDLGNSGSSGM